MHRPKSFSKTKDSISSLPSGPRLSSYTKRDPFPRELPDSRAVAAATRLEDIGVEVLLLNMNFGNMTHAEAMLSLRLFGTEVLPAFR
jgi:hypothetical protein